MYSAKGHLASPRWGCPIRTSPDQSLLAAPRVFSQPSTSFIGSWCQGIHRAPLLARRLDLSNSPSRQDQCSQKKPLYQSSPSLGANVLNVCICLLNYSSVLQVQLNQAREGTKKGSTSVEPLRPREVVSDLCDWRLQLTDDSSLLGSSRPHAPGNRQCARPANIHYILSPSKRASEFVLGRDEGGAEGTRTPDIRLAKAALSQLSYGPGPGAAQVGQPGFEPGTSVLSGLRSSQLSYWPAATPESLPDTPSHGHMPAEREESGAELCVSVDVLSGSVGKEA